MGLFGNLFGDETPELVRANGVAYIESKGSVLGRLYGDNRDKLFLPESPHTRKFIEALKGKSLEITPEEGHLKLSGEVHALKRELDEYMGVSARRVRKSYYRENSAGGFGKLREYLKAIEVPGYYLPKSIIADMQEWDKVEPEKEVAVKIPQGGSKIYEEAGGPMRATELRARSGIKREKRIKVKEAETLGVYESEVSSADNEALFDVTDIKGWLKKLDKIGFLEVICKDTDEAILIDYLRNYHGTLRQDISHHEKSFIHSPASKAYFNRLYQLALAQGIEMKEKPSFSTVTNNTKINAAGRSLIKEYAQKWAILD